MTGVCAIRSRADKLGDTREKRMKWRIGDVTVTKVVEMEVTGGSRFILPEA
ncbi:MAG: hypothetical protein JO032_20360, partial [Alphaproteobacteria bacterium]|nr:hypothetical protein [Alphaproteobacteria bacterium]